MSFSYCLQCREKTGSVDPVQSITSNGRPMVKSKCSICGRTKSTFIATGPKSGGDLQQLITRTFPNTEFHPKLPTKKGLKSAQFFGPGTNINTRVSNIDSVLDDFDKGKMIDPHTDGRVRTKPVSSADTAAFKHDMLYTAAQRKYPNDKKKLLNAKHAADKEMIKDAVRNIRNSKDGVGDKMVNALAAAGFATKVALGMGAKPKKKA